MMRPTVPGQLEQVAVTDEVRLNVGLRVFEAVANARLRAEMNDRVQLEAVRKRLQLPGVCKIDALEVKTVGEVAAKHVEPRLLERGIVIIIEIVDSDDMLGSTPK